VKYVEGAFDEDYIQTLGMLLLAVSCRSARIDVQLFARSTSRIGSGLLFFVLVCGLWFLLTDFGSLACRATIAHAMIDRRSRSLLYQTLPIDRQTNR
jgi:hypothetical protein